MRKDNRYLLDILEAINEIEKYAIQGREDFIRNELIQVWIVHHLQIIGEAARALGSEFHVAHPEIEWARIIGMRNILVHHYFGIDVDIVWDAVQKDLPKLKHEIDTILHR
jgi:uncharacterized protein with HEPN domain